jgi:hypothetical protein
MIRQPRLSRVPRICGQLRASCSHAQPDSNACSASNEPSTPPQHGQQGENNLHVVLRKTLDSCHLRAALKLIAGKSAVADTHQA